jgi:hypothetical protein
MLWVNVRGVLFKGQWYAQVVIYNGINRYGSGVGEEGEL